MSKLHELHELHERRTELVISMKALQHEMQAIERKELWLLATAFLGVPVWLWFVSQLKPVPLWHSFTKIFWTVVLVGAAIWGVMISRRLRKEVRRNLESTTQVFQQLQQLEDRIYRVDPLLKKLKDFI